MTPTKDPRGNSSNGGRASTPPKPPTRRSYQAQRNAAGSAGRNASTRAGKPTRPASKKPVAARGGRGGSAKPKRSVWAKIGWGILGCAVVGMVLGVVAFAIAFAMIKVPEPGEFALAQKTTVYYSDGTTPLGSFSEIDRTIIDTSTLPDYVGNAVVASEDRTFYTNSGIDLRGIARAVINNVSGGAPQGGSTLSQQYVERYYLDTTTTYLGKIKEAILALKINRQQSKETILSNYLNTIYFGRGAYGIEEAAQKYFGHPAAQLTLSESAMLAGIIPAPSAWDPAVDPDQAQQRWRRVLNLMAEDGRISAEEAQSAVFPEVIDPATTSSSMTGTTGYLMQQIRTELVNVAGISDEAIDSGGYTIVSTIDASAQQAAIDAVKALPEDRPENLRVALSAINPANGEIVAEYAGDDYQVIQRNGVTQDRAMAGSTFKPFGLLAYINSGGTLDDVYNGNSPLTVADRRGGEAEIENFANVSYGYVNMLRATANSVNTAYTQMNNAMGPEKTKEAAIALGIPEDTPGLTEDLVNVLGSASPHNIDLTRAYATFASGGVRTDPHIVRQVTKGKGVVIYTAPTEGTRVFPERIVSGILPAMEAAAQWGSADKAGAIGRPVAAKTGSSSDNRSAQFAGFIPQLAAVVSMYQVGEDGSEESITPFGGESEITGSTWPGTVWHDFMAAVTQTMEVQEFTWFTPLKQRSTYTDAQPTPTQTPTPTPTPTQQAPTPEETVQPSENPQPTGDPQPVEPTPTETAQSGGSGTGNH